MPCKMSKMPCKMSEMSCKIVPFNLGLTPKDENYEIVNGFVFLG